MRWLRRITVALLAIYGAAVGVLYATQREMLFPIPSAPRTTPQAAGFPQAEEHVLQTVDGESVIVWHVPPQGDRPVVLFLHGNGDVLAWRVARFRAIVSDGTGLVALSFRGYAGSSGTPSEQGLINDGLAAYDFAAARYAPGRLVLWGFSLGTGVAVALAAEKPVSKLILEAPYSSAVDVAAAKFFIVPVRWLMKDQLRSDLRIAQVTSPLLVMHGARDHVIPIEYGERLYALAPGPKRFVRFAEGGHETLDNFGATDVARAFINAPLRQIMKNP